MKIKSIKNTKGITLIALIITIILMLILAGVVISLAIGENGLFKVAKYAVQKNSEEAAKEKLELVLADLTSHKYTNEAYNENEYIDNYLENEDMTVIGNVVTVDNWNFEIDRSILSIKANLGESNLNITKEVKEYLGKNANDKYMVSVLVKIESNVKIESIEFENTDGTTLTLTPENKTISKDMQIELDRRYTIKINTANGKQEIKSIIEKSTETIKTVEELAKFRDKVNSGLTYEGKTINVVADLDLSSACGENVNGEKISWEPIGNYGTDATHIFKGTFNGNYHKIDNLYINSDKDYQGLFGYVQNGTIENVVIGENSTVIGNYCAGGIAGNAEYSTISNCGNSANIIGSESIGGIIGEISFSNIIGSYNKGAIEGNASVGGIVGKSSAYTANEAVSVEYCYNLGPVIAKSRMGGIIGRSFWTNIYNCYNGKDIKSTSTYSTRNTYSGGIVGDHVFGEVKYCYNAAIVDNTTSVSYVGGVVGGNNSSTTYEGFEEGISVVQYCYNSNNVTSKGYFVGGIVASNFKNSIVKDSYILDDIVVKSKSTVATKNVGTSSNYVGKIVGNAHSNTSTYVDNIGTLSIDDMPSVYEVVNADEENGLNSGDSNYWSKTSYSNDELQTPKLKWESNVK